MMNHGKIWDKLYIEIAKAGGIYLKASDIAEYMRELEDEMIAEYMKWEDEMFAEAIRK